MTGVLQIDHQDLGSGPALWGERLVAVRAGALAGRPAAGADRLQLALIRPDGDSGGRIGNRQQGLGTVIWLAWQTLRTEEMYATLVVIALLGWRAILFSTVLPGG